ncbi:MAG: 4-hydroxy-tetrahydrodipicolinate reductase, partial [Rhodospirillales bacterium]|nr:4-hydroxy-tetrahydrodipicolinate reductase [Rhodospirillales bacterium]
MASRIGIVGVAGRMGRLLVEEVDAAGATLAGGCLRAGSSATAPQGVTLFPDLPALAAASDVVIDFTNAAAVQGNAAALAAAGTPWILGTSGLSAADEAAVARAAERITVVYAANFSAGVNLVLALAERMGA